MGGFLDPMNHYKAKSKLYELENLITQYNKIYKNASDEIEAIYKAKIYAVTIIKEVEDYINDLANTPKDYKSIVYSPNIENHNYESTYDNAKKAKKKKDTINNCVVLTFGVAAILGGPIAWGAALTTVGIAGKKERKNNDNTIEEIDREIKKIRKEIDVLNAKDNEFILEKDYIYKHATYIKENLDEMLKIGIKDYTKFTIDQKKNLGVIVTNVEELAKRMDGSV